MYEITDEQKDAALAALRALNAELEAEAMQRRYAAAWTRLASLDMDTLRSRLDAAPSMADFLASFNEQ